MDSASEQWDVGVSATSFVDTHARGRTYCFQLTLPVANAWGLSGYTCGVPLRSRLKAASRLPQGAPYDSIEAEMTVPCACAFSHGRQDRQALSPRLKAAAREPKE